MDDKEEEKIKVLDAGDIALLKTYVRIHYYKFEIIPCCSNLN